jgi:cytochrome c oxidase subunit IV
MGETKGVLINTPEEQKICIKYIIIVPVILILVLLVLFILVRRFCRCDK